MNETPSDTRSEIDGATIRSAYAEYLCIWAQPDLAHIADPQQPPRPENVAAVRLASDPHTDDDAPMSFNAFTARLRAVLAP